MNAQMFKPVEILMVEDNEGDVFLTRQYFKHSKILNNFHAVGDGLEAMAFLRREGKYAQAPRPDLIILDLNLPLMDGRDVLVEIKADDKLKEIPVVIFTSSDADEDIRKAYRNHANCFICKPLDFDQLNTVIKSIENFWLVIVKLVP